MFFPSAAFFKKIVSKTGDFIAIYQKKFQLFSFFFLFYQITTDVGSFLQKIHNLFKFLFPLRRRNFLLY
ncbi:MAG TPA: hypothetical protein DF364_02900 [Ruminococcaceae bacterium]|nr:hypothetical protein [Oscillospiraceae bacterium]